jgi:hypothetical protein
MKKLSAAFALLTVSLLIANCSGSNGSDPKTTLVAFFEALGKKDMEGARKLATADSKSMFDLIEMGTKMAKNAKDMDMEKFDKAKMEIGDAKIEGDKATVPVKEKASGEMTNFILKKESGGWKVAFDKASMMQMGMDKMKEKDPGAMDSLTRHLDDIKKLNVDSLKDLMNNGMKSLDSLKELMKEKKN